MSKLKFGAPLVSEVDKIIKKIDELIETLTKGLAGAFASVGNTRVNPVDIPWRMRKVPGDEPPDGVDVPTPAYAAGGLITRPHLAMVGEGGEPELIGPIGFMRDALAGALASTRGETMLGAGSTQAITQHITVSLDGQVLTRAIIKRLPRELALAGL